MNKIKVYFGCGLTHAPESFKKEVEEFKNLLREELGLEVLDFIGTSVGTSEDVYMHDIHTCVANCDILIGDYTFPSTGLGWEMGTSVEKHRKPTLALANSKSTVTRLVLGAQCALNPHFRFEYYSNLRDTVIYVHMMVREFKVKSMQTHG